MSKCDVKRGQEFDCMWLLKDVGFLSQGCLSCIRTTAT